MRGLHELIDLATPPTAPHGAPFDWEAAQAAVGTALPPDYRDFCDRYGHGTFHNGWAWSPLTPFAPQREDDLVSTYWRDLLADYGREHRPFPEPNGVLPFAHSELKYFFWWLTVGPPSSWPVLVETDGGIWHRFELTATEVLARALRDELLYPADDAHAQRRATFASSVSATPRSSQPFVILAYGSTRMGSGQPEEHYVDLDLAGTLGGTRRARLDELLAALEPPLRATIEHAEAKRSREVLHVRARRDIDPLCAAVQAWADRVSGWP